MSYINTKKRTEKISYNEDEFELQPILSEEPKHDLNEMVLYKKTRDELNDFIAFCDTERRASFIKKHDVKYIDPNEGVAANFYGQSGTGKTTVAEACAKALGKRIIKVVHGDLSSPYPGVTSRNYRQIFEQAEKEGAVLFVDEAETALGERIAKVTNSADLGVNSTRTTLLSLLNRFNCIVIFATNNFHHYDKAMFRRILFHVDFPPPNKEMLIKIWKCHFNESIPKSFSYEFAADITNNMNGGHIKNIATKLIIKSMQGVELDCKLLKNVVDDFRRNMDASTTLYRETNIDDTTNNSTLHMHE
ncbi:MAG: ATP-binding protein [Cyanobacteria bacterium P01_D01_bin.116]